MKLLLDENLSLRLAESLSDLYRDPSMFTVCSWAVRTIQQCGRMPKRITSQLLSKDSDFAERSVLDSEPPKIIWIRLGNCSTAEIENQLRSAHDTVRAFLEKDEETCLILGRRS